MKSHVHIIESPSADDLFHGRQEGSLLTTGLRLFGIHSKYCLAVNKETFKKGLADIETSNTELGPPLLHLSSHGNKEGLKLSDESFVTWDELRGDLLPINRRMNGFLIISMSSCEGFSGCRMAMKFGSELPFFGLIGPRTTILLSDLALAYLTFYYQILVKDISVEKAVEAMKVASGNPGFEKTLAYEAKRSWTTGIMALIQNMASNSKK